MIRLIKKFIILVGIVFLNNALANPLNSSFRGTFEVPLEAHNTTIPVHYIRPPVITPETPIVMVMYGIKREAKPYLIAWESISQSKGWLVLVPEFPREVFPGANGYNLGNLFQADTEEERKAQAYSMKPNPSELWSIHVPDLVLKHLQKELPDQIGPQFILYGHGAGAQFSHRYALFQKSNLAKLVVVANAGWYTFPDNTIAWPYGVKDMDSFSKEQFAHLAARPTLIVSGEADTKTSETIMRQTDEANDQGENRLVRADNFFEYVRKNQPGSRFNWYRGTVPRATHNDAQMANAVSEWIDEFLKKK